MALVVRVRPGAVALSICDGAQIGLRGRRAAQQGIEDRLGVGADGMDGSEIAVRRDLVTCLPAQAVTRCGVSNGAPVGFRLALRHPERVAGLVVQNGNAYLEGLSDTAHDFIALTPETPGAEATILGLFTLAATRAQYEGAGVAARASPADTDRLTARFLDRTWACPPRHG
ncbi:hypothetical protein SSP24_11560 [Streptomyces spinoverrucosus]|uniref:Uncharacterized protein n=1 Tax=Streptomyces spinoverrucosus TaxID=284043 RepID=A0A4Y3VD47_9ACTN|nr:hypothetical protein SSP24_11560 [Streptomyces spinoverrucosus]GHB35224.1 hypothetical protein GCM10010397_01010 [Streptomyces spinoverrucosus]